MCATSSLKFEAAFAHVAVAAAAFVSRANSRRTCLVSLLMWQSPYLFAHSLTVWASDLTHLGPHWLRLLCLCVQTSVPMYCTVPDWAALACCWDGRTHVPVMNGGVERCGKLAACYTHGEKPCKWGGNHLCFTFSCYYATNNSEKHCRKNFYLFIFNLSPFDVQSYVQGKSNSQWYFFFKKKRFLYLCTIAGGQHVGSYDQSVYAERVKHFSFYFCWTPWAQG